MAAYTVAWRQLMTRNPKITEMMPPARYQPHIFSSCVVTASPTVMSSVVSE